MKCLILVVALLATVAYATKCPAPANVEAKQALINNLLTYINKPSNPTPPVPPIDAAKLKGIGILPKHEVFSLFDERTWPEAVRILKRMMAASSFEEFVKVSETLYPRVNEDLFLYCLSVAIVHRPDAQGVHVPRVHDVYPDKFLTNDVIIELKNDIMKGKKNPVINDTHHYHNHMDVYRRVDYFTEDLGMNSHHYHWHVVNPSIFTEAMGGHKDRTGELFYWMHRQMVARFDSELLSNHLPRVQPFDNWNDQIEMGYAPHLSIQRTGYHYMNRPEGLWLEDLPELTKSQLNQWKNRIIDAIHRRNVTHENGTKIKLDSETGIDVLGHMIASTLRSMNRRYYGNLHSFAHVMAARMADHSGKHMEDNGVMYDVATSARDPMFYCWHKFIDNLFTEYQNTLKPYSKYELTWPEVVIDDFHIETEHDGDEDKNVIHTYYATNTLHLGKGFDYTRDTEAKVLVKHIDHEDFTYVIDVDNNDEKDHHAVFRVFLAPKYDERGHPFSLKEQRTLMVELDKFKATLHPGHNVVRRCSNESSVTMTAHQIFGDLKTSDDEDHCHCGWPEYMLVPKGNYHGMEFEMFVMASDWDHDKVPTTDKACHCKDSISYCGTIYEDYPDKEPMGYPFDRTIKTRGWEEFRTQNMHETDVTIKFTGEVRRHH